MTDNPVLSEELMRLGEASDGAGVNCRFNTLAGESKALYDTWSVRERKSLLRLHRAGVLGAVDVSTVDHVLFMDPEPWAEAAIERARETDASAMTLLKKLRNAEEAQLQQLKEEEAAHRRKLDEEEAARRKQLEEDEAARHKLLKEEEEARHKQRKEEEAARHSQLWNVIDQATRVVRSSNRGPLRVLSTDEVTAFDEQIRQGAAAELGEWPKSPDDLFIYGQGKAALARRTLASQVFGDVARLATRSRPSATSNGRFLGGARGTGKSALIMSLAEMAIRAIPDDCPYSVTALYVSGQDIGKQSAKVTIPPDEVWNHCIGRKLEQAGARLGPMDMSHGPTREWGYWPTTVGAWNFRNREHSELPETKHIPSRMSSERLLLVVDEFDWWYLTERGVGWTTFDWRSILERHGEVVLYLTGSPSIGSTILYKPHEAIELFSTLETRLPGVKSAGPFNDSKLLMLERLRPFDGNEALEFAYWRGKNAIRQPIVRIVEAAMPQFFEGERTKPELEALKRAKEWTDLAKLLGSVAPTARQLEVSKDQHTAVQQGDEDIRSQESATIEDLQMYNASEAWEFCSRGLWTSAALTGLAMVDERESMCNVSTIVDTASAFVGTLGAEQHAEAWSKATRDQKTSRVSRVLLQASDDGIVDVEGVYNDRFQFRSPAHRAGAMQYLLGLPRHGWTSLAIAALVCNPAGSYGIAAEALVASALQGTHVADLLQNIVSHGAIAGIPSNTSIITTREAMPCKIDSTFVPGNVKFVSVTPDTVLKLRKPDDASKRKQAAYEVSPAEVKEGAIVKEDPDVLGGDLVLWALERLRSLMFSHIIRMQFKVGRTMFTNASILTGLAKMNVGVVQSAIEGTCGLLSLGAANDGTEIVVDNILALMRPCDGIGAVRSSMKEHNQNGPVIIALPGDDKEELLRDLEARWGESEIAKWSQMPWPATPKVLDATELRDAKYKILKPKGQETNPWEDLAMAPSIMRVNGKLVHIRPGVITAAGLVNSASTDHNQRAWLQQLCVNSDER